ncbi:MAG: sulfite exporter TauE/SafE family protein [Caldilineaceae bacterium]
MTLAELFAHADICGVATTGVSLNFILLLTTGLLAGFSHCAGMCGPLVSSFVLHQRQQHHQRQSDVTASLLTFQMGRLTAYTLLGLLVGGLGALVRLQVAARGWQSSMSIIMGLIMLAAGLHLLGWLPIGHIAPAGLLHGVNGFIRRTLRQTHPLANFALGMSNALLPCAPIYTMLLLAAAGQSAARCAGHVYLRSGHAARHDWRGPFCGARKRAVARPSLPHRRRPHHVGGRAVDAARAGADQSGGAFFGGGGHVMVSRTGNAGAGGARGQFGRGPRGR